MEEVGGGGGLVEEREELMVSPMGNSTPTLRRAHFLTPPKVSTFTLSGSTSLPQSSSAVVLNPALGSSKVRFTAWGFHKSDWEEWVNHLKPEYHEVWEKAGIYSAIIGSTSTCKRDYELIMGLAEKWCPETNSFVFPWGEATLTLEDVAILGGYSVLGSPVFPRTKVKETAEVELAKAMKELAKGAVNYVKRSDWIKEFKGSGSDIEHEAFLSMWLHPILFSDSSQRIRIHQFCLATRLAKKERLALAPAVLAGIYRDLSLLKSSSWGDRSILCLNSQIQLVQLWAWERFPVFQPMRNCIKVGDPRSFMWDNVKPEKVNNVKLALDSAGETFCWRPYTIGINGWKIPKLYREKEGFQNMEYDLDLQMFAMCLRVSKLVGLDCVQNYFPYRVALQFGLDQDIPFNFVVGEESLENAWTKNYMRRFGATEIYMPSRLFEANVTIRYFEWWKKQAISFGAGGPPRLLDDVMHKVVRRKRTSIKRLKRAHGTVEIVNANNTGDVPPGYSIINIEDYDEDDKAEVERRVFDTNATSGNDLSLAEWDGRLCIKGCTNGGMKPTAGQVGESARASGQIGTSATMARHVRSEKNDNHLHCRDNSKGTKEENGNHTSKAPGVEINCGYSPNIINIESDEDDETEADRRVCDANTTSRNNLKVADRDGRLHDKGCASGRMEVTAGEARESAHVVGQIGASAGTASHAIAENDVTHLDCQDSSNGTAQENGDNTNEAPETDVNVRIARLERELAKIKSMVARAN